MRLRLMAGALMTLGALAACGSPSAAPAQSPLAASLPSQSAASQATVDITTPAEAVTCDDFDVAASHFKQDALYVSLNVGTINDSTPTYADMGEQLSVMLAGARECAPNATAELDELVRAAQASAFAYRTGAAAEDIDAQKSALFALKDAGEAAWTAMGKPAADWELAVKFEW